MAHRSDWWCLALHEALAPAGREGAARRGRRGRVAQPCRPCSRCARQQKMRSDGNYFPSGRKVLTEGFKEAAAGGPE